MQLKSLIFCLCAITFANIPCAFAATITVNTVFDGADALPGNGICETLPSNGICTLRAAIQEANALAGADTINLPAGTFLLDRAGADEDLGSTGDLDITDELTLQGAGSASTFIDANSIDRVVDIHFATTTINDLAIQNGKLSSGYGAGIFSQGNSLTLSNVLIRNNIASGNSTGGGISSGSGNLTMDRCTVSANQAATGAGIYFVFDTLITNSTFSGNTNATQGGGIFARGNLNMLNSTVSGNSAASNGGGIFVFDDPGSSHHVSLFNVTITDNVADSNSDNTGDGGGLFIGKTSGSGDGEPVSLRNSVIAANSDLSSGGGSFGLAKPHNCSGTVVSGGYNLISNNYGCTGLTNGVNGDRVGGSSLLNGISAGLNALDENGGATKTHSPQTSSLLVDGGNPSGCADQNGSPLTVDQRGYSRPAGSTCDIGAVELNGVAPTPIPNATPTVAATPPPVCSTPAKPLLITPGSKVKVAARKVPLDWSSDDCSVRYKVVLRSDSKKGKIAFQKTVKAPSSQVTTKSLAKGHSYFWQVSGCDASKCTKSVVRKFSIKK